MPYKNPDINREYQKQYKRMRRTGGRQTPCQTLLPMPFRLRTAHDVLILLEQQINAVVGEDAASTLEKARTVGYLAGISLKAVEVTELASRIDSLEMVLKRRKSG